MSNGRTYSSNKLRVMLTGALRTIVNESYQENFEISFMKNIKNH